MKVLCIHCQNICKSSGLIECVKYNAKSNRAKQLETEIKKAYKDRDYELAKSLSEELFRMNHG